MSTWWSYFFPQKLFESSTPYNRYIRVNDEFGEKKLLVNGSPQSGKYIRYLWKHAFNHLPQLNTEFKNILVLGVGGGTVIKMVHKWCPEARIIGIDIDPTMIMIAKDFFGLQSTSRITLKEGDAKEFIRKNTSNYDCCIIDIFSGRTIPSFVSSQFFLSHVKRRLLMKKGSLYINYLREDEYGNKSEKLKKTLNRLFPRVQDYAIARNRFFFASIV